MGKLDALDRKLLDAVQRDASQTSEQLSEHVGLSASAIQRRLGRLRRDGVIRGIVALVDPGSLGPVSHFIVGVEVERERPELMSGLRRWLANEDSVQEIFFVTGAWDLVLVVTTPGVNSYDELMSRMLAENPNVRRFTTNVALAVHKRELFVRASIDDRRSSEP